MFRLTFDAARTESGERLLGSSGRLAYVVIDRSDEPANVLRPVDVDRVESLLDAIDGEPDIAAVIIRSGKPTSFLTGLDVEVLDRAQDRRELEAFARRSRTVLDRIAAAGRPVVAAIEGACLGAGLSLALACHHRVGAHAPATRMGFTDVNLGVIPAGGALDRLPRLVGYPEALELVLSGTTVSARRAHQMGLIDAAVRPEELDAEARRVALALAAGRTPTRLGGLARARAAARVVIGVTGVGRRIVVARARREIRGAGPRSAPAPLCVLDLMAAGADPTAEAKAFAELAIGQTARNLVGVFIASRELRGAQVLDARGDVVAAGRLRSVGVVGGGPMGADVAVAAAEAGLDAHVTEVRRAALARTLSRIGKHFDRCRADGVPGLVDIGRRLSAGLDPSAVAAADLVIESVPEDASVKRGVLAGLEDLVAPDAVLASTTLALPIARLGSDLRWPERFVGLHFFRPVRRMPLVEVVRTPSADPAALATCLALCRRLGKTPVIVRDGPGFYTTRIMAFYLLAALDLIHLGHSIEAIDRGARRAGWPVGPMRLLDEIGLPRAAAVAHVLADAFPDRVEHPTALGALVMEGRTGSAEGAGFYRYPRGRPPMPDPGVYERFDGRPTTAPTASPDELGERLTLVAAVEAVRCLEERIIASPRDGDVAAVLGIGFPAARGGPFRHLGERGLGSVRSRLAALQDRFGPTFAAPALLQDLARRGRDFPVVAPLV